MHYAFPSGIQAPGIFPQYMNEFLTNALCDNNLPTSSCLDMIIFRNLPYEYMMITEFAARVHKQLIALKNYASRYCHMCHKTHGFPRDRKRERERERGREGEGRGERGGSIGMETYLTRVRENRK